MISGEWVIVYMQSPIPGSVKSLLVMKYLFFFNFFFFFTIRMVLGHVSPYLIIIQIN